MIDQLLGRMSRADRRAAIWRAATPLLLAALLVLPACRAENCHIQYTGQTHLTVCR